MVLKRCWGLRLNVNASKWNKIYLDLLGDIYWDLFEQQLRSVQQCKQNIYWNLLEHQVHSVQHRCYCCTVTAWARPLQPRHRRRADTVSKVKAFRELGSFKRSREDPSAQKKETLEDNMSTLMCFYLLEWTVSCSRWHLRTFHNHYIL